jgi:hypothetical protein
VIPGAAAVAPFPEDFDPLAESAPDDYTWPEQTGPTPAGANLPELLSFRAEQSRSAFMRAVSARLAETLGPR